MKSKTEAEKIQLLSAEKDRLKAANSRLAASVEKNANLWDQAQAEMKLLREDSRRREELFIQFLKYQIEFISHLMTFRGGEK